MIVFVNTTKPTQREFKHMHPASSSVKEATQHSIITKL